jgi:hypothetical protein
LLPAPGPPVQLPDLSSLSHLSVRLRWGVPDELKRRIILHQGYRLWRMSWAQGSGYVAAAPTLAQLMAHVTAGQAQLVSEDPIFIAKPLSPAQAQLLTHEPDRSYITDDLGKLSAGANYVMPADGAEYAYIVTPRDVLGRHGQPSLAGRGKFLKTENPPVPKNPAVELIYGTPDDAGARPQHFRFSFDQNPADPGNPTTVYEVFRGTGEATDGQNQPIVGNMLTPILHTGAGRIVVNDMPPYPFGTAQQVWFLVRAKRVTPAGTFVSELSPPVFAMLQDHQPPLAPTAASEGASLCPQPGVVPATPSLSIVDGETAPDDGLFHFRMICDRLDQQVQWAEFAYQTGIEVEVVLGRIEFAGEDRVQIDFTLPEDTVEDNLTTFTCRVDDRDGSAEVPAAYILRGGAPMQTDQIQAVSFVTAVMTPTALDTANEVHAYFYPPGSQSSVLSTVTITPGSRVLKGTAAGLNPHPGFVVERNFGGDDWRSVGFAQMYGGELRFNDSTLDGPSSTAADYRVNSLGRLRSCASSTLTRISPTRADGSANKARICMEHHNDSRELEYRIYRRIDDGPLALIDEGRIVRTLGSNLICYDDAALPVMGGIVHYYGQIIGSNGGSSTTTGLGAREVPPAELPRPVLAPPIGTGTGVGTDFKVQLRWVCPPESVDRFEITLATNDIKPLSPSVAERFRSMPRRRHKPDPARTTTILFVPPPAELVRSLQTPRIGSASLGDGPVFTQEIEVEPDTTYQIWVQAVSRTGTLGKVSAQYSFEWKLPPGINDENVPWPFRALPEPASTTGEVVNMTPDPNHGEGMIWPPVSGGQVGFAIGSIDLSIGDPKFEFNLAGGTIPGVGYRSYSEGLVSEDFNTHLFRIGGKGTRQVLPAALYRQQLPDVVEWPVVSGDVVQVSPLISHILWTPDPAPLDDHNFDSFLRDPFIGVQLLPDGSEARLYLLDTTPRAVGAKYRYWLVCFDATTGAPEYVIPATLNKVEP